MTTDYLIDIDRVTGEFISGWRRIRQSIDTILTTRLRTRIMRLWWGSDFLEMQDKPGNEEVLLNGIQAAIEAINEYEPEFTVTRLTINEFDGSGRIVMTVDGIDKIDTARRRVSLSV